MCVRCLSWADGRSSFLPSLVPVTSWVLFFTCYKRKERNEYPKKLHVNYIFSKPSFPKSFPSTGELISSVLKSKNVPLYRAIGEKPARERFLIVISVCISMVLGQTMATTTQCSLNWIGMCCPKLRKLAYDLQHRFFSIKGSIIMSRIS